MPVDRVPGKGGLLQRWSFGPRGLAPLCWGLELEDRVAVGQQRSGRGTLGNFGTGRKGRYVDGRHTAGDVLAHLTGSGRGTLVPVEGRIAAAVSNATLVTGSGKAGTIGKEDTREESYVLGQPARGTDRFVAGRGPAW